MMVHVSEVLTKSQVAQFREQLDRRRLDRRQRHRRHQPRSSSATCSFPRTRPPLSAAARRPQRARLQRRLPCPPPPRPGFFPPLQPHEGGGNFATMSTTPSATSPHTPPHPDRPLSHPSSPSPDEYDGASSSSTTPTAPTRPSFRRRPRPLPLHQPPPRHPPVTQAPRRPFFWLQSMVRDDSQRTLLHHSQRHPGPRRRTNHGDDRVIELTGILPQPHPQMGSAVRTRKRRRMRGVAPPRAPPITLGAAVVPQRG
jgi:hypothetical protein